jgi:hypothetical protein
MKRRKLGLRDGVSILKMAQIVSGEQVENKN